MQTPLLVAAIRHYTDALKVPDMLGYIVGSQECTADHRSQLRRQVHVNLDEFESCTQYGEIVLHDLREAGWLGGGVWKRLGHMLRVQLSNHRGSPPMPLPAGILSDRIPSP